MSRCVAAPPSRAYRLRKFVRKHRGAVIAASLVLFALVGRDCRDHPGIDRSRRQASGSGNQPRVRHQGERDPRLGLRGAGPECGLRDGCRVPQLRSLKGGAAIGDPLIVAMMQERLGCSLTALGEAADAIVVLTKSTETRKARLGPDQRDTLQSMGNLATAFLGAGELDMALPLFEEAYKRAKARFGPDHPDTLSTSHNLAYAYDLAGKLDVALPLYQETLRLQKARLGPEHRDTVGSMHNLGTAYQKAGKLKQGLPLLEETLRVRKALLGGEHPGTLASMNNLAIAYREAGKMDLAMPLFEAQYKLAKARLRPRPS